MNCQQISQQLPLFVYGELPAEDAAQVEAHLADCPRCQAETAGLRQVRRLLDAAPSPVVRIDVPRLLSAEAERQRRRARGWRRAAVAVSSLAAAVLVLILFRQVEFRWEGHQAVLRWGLPAVAAVTPGQPELPATIRGLSPEERLQLLSEVVRALAQEVANHESSQQQELAQLRASLTELQRQALRHWNATDREVAALYLLTQTRSTAHGEKQ